MLIHHSFTGMARVYFHHLPGGMPHVHERFVPHSHDGHTIVAVCGKGGVGKTAFSAMLASVCADSGSFNRILVVDADPALGLAMALEVDVRHTIGEVREQIIKTAQNGDSDEGKILADRLDYLILESLIENERFSFLAMGRSEALGCYCSVNDLLRDAMDVLAKEFDLIIIDGEAGLEQINRQVVAGVDRLVLVTDASKRSIATVEQLLSIAVGEEFVKDEDCVVVASRPAYEGQELLDALGDNASRLIGVVPNDKEVALLDSEGVSLEELDMSSEAYHSVYHIAEHLFAR